MTYPFAQTDSDFEMKAHLKALVEDAETLLCVTEKETNPEVLKMRDRMKKNISHMKYKIEELEYHIKQKAKATDEYVHDNPWKSVGIAAAFGFLVGLILVRK